MIESHGIIFSAKSAVSAKPKPQPSPTIIKNRKYPSANRRLSVTKMNGAVISSICLLSIELAGAESCRWREQTDQVCRSDLTAAAAGRDSP